MFDYAKLPLHMRDGMKRYIDYGIPPGSFLIAVLCNDLKGAFMRADNVNADRMRDFVDFLYNEAPSQCHGSPAVVTAWMTAGGLEGLRKPTLDKTP